jgi:hypothetical protein
MDGNAGTDPARHQLFCLGVPQSANQRPVFVYGIAPGIYSYRPRPEWTRLS